MSDLLKDRMKDEAKADAYFRFLNRYGLYGKKHFYVDEFRRFTKYAARLWP